MTSSRDDAGPTPLPDSPERLLGFARARRAEADKAEADLLELAVSWAMMHPAESIHEAETVSLRSFGDTGIPVAGPGAPLVAEFSVAEFAAAIGLGTRHLRRPTPLPTPGGRPTTYRRDLTTPPHTRPTRGGRCGMRGSGGTAGGT